MPEDRSPRADFYPLISYSTFTLVRNPTLVPASEKRAFQAMLIAVEQVRRELQPLGVLNDLTDQQRTEVAAHVLDIDDDYQRWRVVESRLPRLKLMAVRGPGHVRILAKKLQTLHTALADAEAHSAKLNAEIHERLASPLRGARRAIDAAMVALIGPRESVEQYTSSLRQRHELAISYLPADPKLSAASRLASYFRATASPTLNDAYVRTATIGNSRWAWSYDIVTGAFDRPDCPTLRKALERFDKRSRIPAPEHPPRGQRTRSKKRR